MMSDINSTSLVVTEKQTTSLSDLFTNQDLITDEYFVNNYLQFVRLYISKGKPSPDTIRTYKSSINQFIFWCFDKKYNPLKCEDFHIRIYLAYLNDKQYKPETISIKIIAIKAFFHAAVKLKLIKINPCEDIQTSSSYFDDSQINFFTPDQIYEINEVFNSKKYNDFTRYRNTSILYLMAVEGLRNVEIHRLNIEDIDWTNGTVYVRGKGHDRIIYPCEETFKYLDLYLQNIKINAATLSAISPLFISDSNKNTNGRLSRNGIRFIMNQALELTNYKKKGISCHVFRHSCGTNLYAAYKDLRLVQETLGHRDPKTTARYAHLQERMTKRKTEAILPRKKD